MANRYLLHINKLNDFKQWLTDNEWAILDTKGTYEVLRARKLGIAKPLIVYEKTGKEHLSIADSDIKYVESFLKSRKLCDYCKPHKEKAMLEKYRITAEISYLCGDVTLDIEYDGVYESESASIDINYCPMCGRKLGD